MNLHQPLHVLPGVGPKSAEKYAKLGIENLQDLLLYFPFRYEDFKTKQVLELEDGEKAVLSGQVVTPASVQYYGFKRNRLRFSLKQGEVVFAVNFFNQPYLADKIELGATLAVFGKWDRAKASLTGMKVLAQVEDDLQPVYRLAQGISQASLVKVIKTAFDQGLDLLIEENLPQSLLDKYKLMSRCQAVRAMHFPKDLAEYKQALRRIKFEELFYFQMQLQTLKSENRVQGSGLVLNWSQEKVTEVKENLPFALTQAQEKSLQNLFPDLKLALLTGSLKVAEKREVLETIAKGEADFIIGTHALIQDGVDYARLGLIIIDEQHRFGVGQRRILREKGDNPDVLMMTATPIPRTLAITAFGDMDVSIIDQMPAGRKPIVTRWIKHEQLPQVLTWLEGEIQKGSQAYVISPLIEESEALDLKNAIALSEELTAHFVGKAEVALLHGKMKSDDKDQIMQDFKERKTDILVSTTVIEVGVNVPNATVIIIMDADRFGLSQLHQLRGRVGRGDKQSYAVLVANPKTESGKDRMRIMTETTNGFVLAEEDLKMRGSGEIFGTRQSGLPEFQVADIIEDFPILEEARKVASYISSIEGWKEDPEWRMIALHLEKREHLD